MPIKHPVKQICWWKDPMQGKDPMQSERGERPHRRRSRTVLFAPGSLLLRQDEPQPRFVRWKDPMQRKDPMQSERRRPARRKPLTFSDILPIERSVFFVDRIRFHFASPDRCCGHGIHHSEARNKQVNSAKLTRKESRLVLGADLQLGPPNLFSGGSVK